MNTYIHFVLDRSGSMWETLTDTIGGFNSFINSQKNDENGECYMSLYQFDHEYEIVYQNKEIKDVEILTEQTFIPRGQTALLDAIGRTIICIDRCLSNSENSENSENSNIIVVILTDGYENSSKEFTHSKITKMIDSKNKNGWKFVFLGADQDAIKTATTLGINQNSAMTYAQTPQNVRACFSGLSSAVMRARSGESSNICFTEDERMNSQT